MEKEEDHRVCHDARWTEEAIANVLDNAVKYSGEHTIVTVRVTALVRNVLIEIEDEEKVLIEGKDIFALKDDRLAEFRRKKIGFIFQDFNLIPSLNVWENVVLPLGLDNRRVRKQGVEEVLSEIGLTEKKETMPNALSGGQKQRVAIARALVTRPALILADEPTGNLDSQTELEVMSLLKRCVKDFGQTLVMITHDEMIAQMADRVIEIEDGKAVSGR